MSEKTKGKYRAKAVDSFNTRKKIFLYSLALEDQLNGISEEDFKLGFQQFKLEENLTIVNSYAREYFQKEYNELVQGKKTVNTIYEELIAWEAKNKELLTVIQQHYIKEIFPALFPLEDFENLLQAKNCGYCEIDQDEIDLLRKGAMLLNKHETRGYSFEMDRKQPNLEYTYENCVMSCYWCNNAKTDEFDAKEFKVIGKAIKEIWDLRLGRIKKNDRNYNPFT